MENKYKWVQIDGCMILGKKFEHCIGIIQLATLARRPLLIEYETGQGTNCIFKAITSCDEMTNRVRLASYNHEQGEQWLPVENITDIHIVEQIRYKKESKWITKTIEAKNYSNITLL